MRRSGKSYAHPLVVLIAQENGGTRVRVGVAAGRTIGTAVSRNRAKRILREVMRSLLPNIASGWDLILIARPALISAAFEDVRQAVINLLHRAQLFTSAHES